jgi:choline dehydrogenase-like flavoprotein
MAERKRQVDAVIIGYGWTGAIMAKTLTDAGLSVVALERGPGRDTSPDFEYPRIADELKYGIRGDLWQPLANETVTIRHGMHDVAARIANTVRSSWAMGLAARELIGMASFGAPRRRTCDSVLTSSSATEKSSFPRT